MMNSLPDNVVLLHSALGCGSCSHSQNANVRMGGNVRWGRVKDGVWLSTALDEADVISGGEPKLEQAIIEADRRYNIFWYGCWTATASPFLPVQPAVPAP